MKSPHDVPWKEGCVTSGVGFRVSAARIETFSVVKKTTESGDEYVTIIFMDSSGLPSGVRHELNLPIDEFTDQFAHAFPDALTLNLG